MKNLFNLFAALGVLILPSCTQTTTASQEQNLAALEQELPPSQTSVDMADLQGSWTGTATLLEQIRRPGNTGSCSPMLDMSWNVNGSAIIGTSINPRDREMTYAARIDERGHWSGHVKSHYGSYQEINGWFRDDRAIGYMRSSKGAFYCAFRIDLIKAG